MAVRRYVAKSFDCFIVKPLLEAKKRQLLQKPIETGRRTQQHKQIEKIDKERNLFRGTAKWGSLRLPAPPLPALRVFQNSRLSLTSASFADLRRAPPRGVRWVVTSGIKEMSLEIYMYIRPLLSYYGLYLWLPYL